ncbi:Low complexity protein [Cryptosporidium canis]|uniref:Low complexity protein n=1 Tax=Cryptosporidium canis TaxID=195482 RepID=A0ABQ8P9V9_9CRYT|nr:Low complexity protein [Cryptosporidium canis]
MNNNKKYYQFIIPKKDSNLLKFLDNVDITYRGDEAFIYFKSDKESLNCDYSGIAINSIICQLQGYIFEVFEFDQNFTKESSYPEVDIPLGLCYILSLSYLWSKIINIYEKKQFLSLILRYVEILKHSLTSHTEKSQINNLFTMIIFCITNIVIQEFDNIEALINENKNVTKNKVDTKQRRKKSPKYNYEDFLDESEIELDSNQLSDDDRLDGKDFEGIITDQFINKSTIQEISFILVKSLIKLSHHYSGVNFSSIGLSEWSLILSLRITNLIKKLGSDLEVEAFNKLSKVNISKWENLSEALLINILKQIKFSDQSDESDCLNTSLFEVIANSLLNGSIDLISNINQMNNPNNRNSIIFKDFPNFISVISNKISQEFSSHLFIYILENLGKYWAKMDKIEDIGEDSNVIVCVSSYIESISIQNPYIILNNIILIKQILNIMISYKLRSCFISSISNSLIEIKNKNEVIINTDSSYTTNNSQSIDYNIESRPQIIESIDLILERVYDKHHNCRTRSIQSLQKLFINDIVPYSFFISILKEIKTRTLDESSYVRSSSFSLLRTMLRKATENYYHLPLNYEQISNLLNNINDELSKLSNNDINNLNNTIINSNMESKETMEQEITEQSLIKKKESEYELMKILLIDAKEVSLIMENILEHACNSGIYSKVNSDVSSCILFICEAVSLNVIKGQSYISNVFRCIWRVNNVNILNSVVHGFFIIVFNNTSNYSLYESQEHFQNDLENDDDQILKHNFNGKIIINQSSIKNLLKLIELLNENDLMNLSKLLQLLTSNNTQISKKYSQSFDLLTLKSSTMNEISLIANKVLGLNVETEKYLKISLDLLLVILKVESINNNSVLDAKDKKSGFELIYKLLIDSLSIKNYVVLEKAIKCLNLIKISDDVYTNDILSRYTTILSNIDSSLMNSSLLINIINSVFILIANPSNIKFASVSNSKQKLLQIDIFINGLFGYYHKILKNSKEITIIEVSHITNLLSHVILKYGNFVECLYSKWKYLYSSTQKSSNSQIKLNKENQNCGIISLEEEYLEYIQLILENQLLSKESIFYFIVPIINVLSRDPFTLVNKNYNTVEDEKCHKWQLDYSRNCAIISLCKLTSLTTKLLNINEDLMNELSIKNINMNSKLSNLFEMPNIQLIFSFIYNPSSFNFISRTQMDKIMLNIILCTNDLLTRYPNIIDPWMEKQYTFLNYDNDSNKTEINYLKYNIMLIINYLLNIGFIKPKDILLLSYLRCINKEEFNSELYSLANSFFQEFFKDLNNQLVINIIPLLINQLALDYSHNYNDKAKIQNIIYQTQYLLHFISNKDVVCSNLIPKLLSRISLLNDPSSIELYIIALESLKLGSKTRCISKVIENINLISFHIQEFDLIRNYFARILQNNTISNQNHVNSEIISLLKNVNSKIVKYAQNPDIEKNNFPVIDTENFPKN